MSSLSGASFDADVPSAAPRGTDASSAADPAAQLASRLFRQAQHGDRAAFGRIIELYQDRLYNAILRLVGEHEEARELTQEAFTRALLKLDSFRGDAGPYTWLFRIAVNLSISHLRKVQRHRTFSLVEPGSGRDGDASGNLVNRVSRLGRDNSDGPHEVLEQCERNEAVLAALGRLDAEYRAVLVMRDVEGFDYQQMADVLDVPLGTLKSRLFRARLSLRDELSSYLKE